MRPIVASPSISTPNLFRTHSAPPDTGYCCPETDRRRFPPGRRKTGSRRLQQRDDHQPDSPPGGAGTRPGPRASRTGTTTTPDSGCVSAMSAAHPDSFESGAEINGNGDRLMGRPVHENMDKMPRRRFLITFAKDTYFKSYA